MNNLSSYCGLVNARISALANIYLFANSADGESSDSGAAGTVYFYPN